MKWTAEVIIYRKNQMPFCYIDNEMVILDTTQGTYLAFNKIATCIWRLLEHPLSFSMLCHYLHKIVLINHADYTIELLGFLTLLLDKNLIAITVKTTADELILSNPTEFIVWEKPILMEMNVCAVTKSGGENPAESNAGLYS